jgi:hypothetical protein
MMIRHLSCGLLAFGAIGHAAGAATFALTPLTDSVVDTNALVFDSDGEWGRGINSQMFSADTLITFGGYQYTTWYRNTSGNPGVYVARRTTTGATPGAWEVVSTGSTLANGLGASDVHNTISLGISKGDGRLHMSWDHHVNQLKYRNSAAGLTTTNKAAWGAGMFGSQRNWLVTSGSSINDVTYPTFVSAPNGNAHFLYRRGFSGDGTFLFNTYTHSTGTWSTPRELIVGAGNHTEFGTTSTSRNGYFNSFDYGPDGKLHVTWTWREAATAANHDINYAYSEDGGTTWKNNAGVQVANLAANDPLRIEDAGLVVKQINGRQSLYNQTTQSVDITGRVHTIAVHRRPEAAYAWQSGDDAWEPTDSGYFHYFRDTDGTWEQRPLPTTTGVGSRPSMATDAAGNVYAIYTNRGPEDGDYKYNPGTLVISAATAASDYTDWTILYQGTQEIIGEPYLDKQRLLNDGILSIFAQDNPTVSTRTGTSLHVIEFAVPEPSSAMGVVGMMGMTLLSRRRSRG